MRYMATVYISDVMDVVASTVEIQGWTEQYGPPECVYSNTVVLPGVGETDPRRWLARALLRLHLDMAPPASEGSRRVGADGGLHTLSETGDSPEIMVGWTAVGGPGGDEESVPRSGSARI
jgi:hypothetical protein